MTDKELLELAAKAAGLPVGSDQGEYQYRDGGTWVAGLYATDNGYPLFWNSLIDDRDALRLAVRADIEVFQGDNCDRPAAFAGYFKPASLMGRRYCIEYHGDHHCDQVAATRRAITRAAAEIGARITTEDGK
ncbi:hypothetical protein [Burkholderia gladioli]|uniref:hypothetical protein n=1 Tax=Burkholderia gladioli TaxID=28095 RepID=UPI0016414B67|nr:hypothetical protein [Burkholderia gladioli]